MELSRDSLFRGLKSTTEIKNMIKEKKIDGWDDVRLGTIGSLKRRGIRGEAIRNFILSMGVNKNEVKVDINNLYSFNKGIIDKESNRYFAVFDPKKIRIEGFKSRRVKISIHPDFPERGYRAINCGNEFYVQDNLQRDRLYRFMHLFNFLNNTFVSDKLVKDAKLIHWVPSSGNVKVEVLMDDNTKLKGYGEESLKKVNIGETVQFERNFFCILEEKSKDKKNFNNFVTNLLAARYMAERLNAIKESEYNYSLILCVNIGDVYGKVISKYAQVSKEEFKSDYNQLKKEIKSQQIKETA